MNEEEEKIIEAIALPQDTTIEKCKKAISAAFATKKAVMAGYALFAGVTVGTATLASNGMTADELQTQQTMEDTITKLSEQNILLETKIIELQSTHTINAHDHPVAEHEHPRDQLLLESMAVMFGHTHTEVPAHEHPVVEHDTTHEHDLVEHEHDLVEHEHAIQTCPIVDPNAIGEHVHRFDPLRGCRSFPKKK